LLSRARNKQGEKASLAKFGLGEERYLLIHPIA
jgi:hypothetical protein